MTDTVYLNRLVAIEKYTASIEAVALSEQQQREHLADLYVQLHKMGCDLRVSYTDPRQVRVGGGGYEQKRTSALLKRKDFMDEEFPILEVIEGNGKREGIAGAITCALPDGRTFNAGLKGDYDYCRNMLMKKEQLVGKQATIVYFHRTPDGIPRFPVMKTIAA